MRDVSHAFRIRDLTQVDYYSSGFYGGTPSTTTYGPGVVLVPNAAAGYSGMRSTGREQRRVLAHDRHLLHAGERGLSDGSPTHESTREQIRSGRAGGPGPLRPFFGEGRVSSNTPYNGRENGWTVDRIRRRPWGGNMRRLLGDDPWDRRWRWCRPGARAGRRRAGGPLHKLNGYARRWLLWDDLRLPQRGNGPDLLVVQLDVWHELRLRLHALRAAAASAWTRRFQRCRPATSTASYYGTFAIPGAGPCR